MLNGFSVLVWILGQPRVSYPSIVSLFCIMCIVVRFCLILSCFSSFKFKNIGIYIYIYFFFFFFFICGQ